MVHTLRISRSTRPWWFDNDSIGSSKLIPVELSTRRLHSRDDKWRHRGGMSCTCPGRLEVSRGIVEAKHVTSDRRKSSAVYLTNTNSYSVEANSRSPTLPLMTSKRQRRIYYRRVPSITRTTLCCLGDYQRLQRLDKRVLEGVTRHLLAAIRILRK